jgi:hypothetical protein
MMQRDICATVRLGGFLPGRHGHEWRKILAVMMISDVRGQTQDGYDALLAKVSPTLRSAQGFMMHASHPIDGGWRVVEIWQSREDAGRFYATAIAPHLPKGIQPKVSFSPLHDVVRP